MKFTIYLVDIVEMIVASTCLLVNISSWRDLMIDLWLGVKV